MMMIFWMHPHKLKMKMLKMNEHFPGMFFLLPTGTEGSAVDSLTLTLAASMDVVEAEWKAVLW